VVLDHVPLLTVLKLSFSTLFAMQTNQTVSQHIYKIRTPVSPIRSFLICQKECGEEGSAGAWQFPSFLNKIYGHTIHHTDLGAHRPPYICMENKKWGIESKFSTWSWLYSTQHGYMHGMSEREMSTKRIERGQEEKEEDTGH
jgi:hypothetical protein